MSFMKFFYTKFSRSTVYNKACMCNKQLLIDIQLLGLLKNDHRHEAEISRLSRLCRNTVGSIKIFEQ